MTALVLRKALRRSLDQIRYVTPVRPGDQTQGLVTAVYLQVERDFGMLAPPVALHSPAPGPLAACWLMLRETLIAPGQATRAAKEVVAAAVSLGNTCPYCVAVHGAALYGLAKSEEATAIAEDHLASISDPALRMLAVWCRDSQATGLPFPAEQAPELLGVALTFHYLNRMVNVFLGESPLPSSVPAAARAPMMRLLGSLMRPTQAAQRHGAELLPAAALPGDMSWAAGNPRIADALARAATSIEAAGARSVPEPVRGLVQAEVAAWTGHQMSLDRAWLENALAGLAPAHRSAGRVALLTALASYRVTGSDIAALRLDHPGDEALIDLTSWSSLTAARACTLRLLGDQLAGLPLSD